MYIIVTGFGITRAKTGCKGFLYGSAFSFTGVRGWSSGIQDADYPTPILTNCERIRIIYDCQLSIFWH